MFSSWVALSAFARIFLSVIAAADEEAELPIRSNGKMSQFQWISGEWSFASAMAHKDIVMQASFRVHVCLLECLFVVFAQIMYDAPTKGNRNFLGIVYDMMARSKWAQRAERAWLRCQCCVSESSCLPFCFMAVPGAWFWSCRWTIPFWRMR